MRATRRLNPRVGRSWLVASFSQGGHAALFVGLMATRYAPELDFRGTVALAPPVHLPLLISIITANGAAPVSVFPPFLLAGLPTSHPDFDARRFLTDAVDRLVESAMTVTLVEMFRATARLTNEEVGLTHLHTRPGMDRILHACQVPTARMDRPVLITAESADEIVPVAVVERFVGDLGEAGTSVRFVCHNYEVFALRLVQAFGEPPGSAKALAVRQGYRALWRAVAARSDTDDDGRVSGAEFLRWINSQAAHGDGFDYDIAPLAQAVLTLIDHDQNGTLQAAEFRRLLRACDLPEGQVHSVFNSFDRDHDGSVSVPEIVAAVHEFCLDPTPGKPGHWLFGQF